MSDNKDDKDTQSMNIAAISGVPCHLALSTGTNYTAIIPDIRVMIDAHMHIMSLNCTPMTLQWATVYMNVPFKLGKSIGKTRQEMTRTAAGRDILGGVASKFKTGDLGKVGQFSTDLIADIYMGTAKNADFSAKLYWLLTAKKLDKIAKEADQSTEESKQSAVGKEMGVEELNNKKKEEITCFEKMTSDYFRFGAPLRMNFAMPMDLSYAHFWGLHDIPIYLPVLGGNTFYFINDFNCLEGGFIDSAYEPLDYIPPLNGDGELPRPEEAWRVLTYNATLSDFINKYYDSITYICSNGSGAVPLLTFGTANHLDGLPEEPGLFAGDAKKNQYKTDLEVFKNKITPILESEKHAFVEADNKKYRHYLDEVKGDTTEQFEDYWEQAAKYESAALKYPLNIIPFFHYDPRRYYLENTRDSILDALDQKHAFFNLCEIPAENIFKTKKSVITFHDFTNRGTPQADRLSVRDYFKQVLFDGVHEKADDGIIIITKEKSKKLHTDCMSEYLYPKGPFLGVKVYPPLGYPGDLFSDVQKKRFDYPEKRFENYLELFRYCKSNKIPVTSHGSPLGMSIADGHNYLINDLSQKEYIKSNNLSQYPKALDLNKYNCRDSAIYVDDIATHPDHWRRLLEHNENELKDLKLCLAHFSGMDQWTSLGYPAKIPWWYMDKDDWTRRDWREKVISLIEDFPNVYTDISCYTIDKNDVLMIDKTGFEQLLRKCSAEERKVLNDAYDGVEYHNCVTLSASDDEKARVRTILRKYDVLDDGIKKLATGLANAIKQHEDLRWRLLMGSDWYMAEMGKTGVGGYYIKMFEVLAEVTRQVNQGWDAWHQFSVVNPLLFLGLIETPVGSKKPVEKIDASTGKKYYEVTTKRLETAYGKVKGKMVNIPDWKALSGIPGKKTIDDYSSLFTDNLKKLQEAVIYTAEEIKDTEDKLLILQYAEDSK